MRSFSFLHCRSLPERSLRPLRPRQGHELGRPTSYRSALERRAFSGTTFPRRASRRASSSLQSCATTSNRPALVALVIASASVASRPSALESTALQLCNGWATGGPASSARLDDSASFFVRPAGLEPATSGLETHCSIQLSYGRIDC
jgi:hypothetical protein